MKKMLVVLFCLLILCGGAFAKVNTAGAFCLNFFLPITGGIGSFAQGDYISGGIIMGTSLAGTLMAVIPYVLSNDSDENSAKAASGILFYGGVAILLGSWIAGMVRPWQFQKEQAAKGITLYQNPFTDQCTTLSLNPVIDTVNKNYGFSTVIRY